MTNQEMSLYFQKLGLSDARELGADSCPDRLAVLRRARDAFANAVIWAEADAKAEAVFEVTYYDAKLSKKGRGTQTAVFRDFAKASEFASKNRYRAKPCTVVTRVAATSEQAAR